MKENNSADRKQLEESVTTELTLPKTVENLLQTEEKDKHTHNAKTKCKYENNFKKIEGQSPLWT